MVKKRFHISRIVRFDIRSITMLIFALLIVLSNGLIANQYRSRQTGTWNDVTAPVTWEVSTNGGSSWANATTFPGQVVNDTVLIRNGHIVTLGNTPANAIAMLTVGEGTSGTLQIGSSTTPRTLNINGNVTVASGGSVVVGNNTVTHNFNFGGNLTVNGSFDLRLDVNSLCNATMNGAGTQTISGSGTTIDFYSLTISAGTTKTLVHNITINNLLTINAGTFDLSTYTANRVAAGGTLTLAAGTTMRVGGTNSLPSNYTTYTLNATSTVEYYGTVQTVTAVTYGNLTLSGSGLKTTTGATVNRILSMEETATASAAPTYGANATLQYNTATGRTVGVEWITTFAATGGVIIANTGVITLNAAKTFNASIPLTINSSASLNTSAANNWGLTFGGNYINNGGTLTANTSAITIANTMATQSIAGFTTLGTVTMTKTAGTATLQGAISSGALTINGAGGTLNLGTGFTHSVLSITFSNGTLNLGSSIINVAGAVTLTTGTLDLGSGTMNLTGNFSGAGTLVGGTGTMNFNGSSAQTAVGKATYNVIKINNTAGVILTSAATIPTLTIGDVIANSVLGDGGFPITSTGTLNLTSGTFRLGSAGTATTFPAFATRTIAFGTVVEYAAGVAQVVSTSPSYSNLIFSGAGTKNTSAGTLTIGSDWTIGSAAALNTNNTVVALSGDLIKNADLAQGTGDISIAGNWIDNSGTYTPNTGTIVLNGTSQQTIPALTFYGLTINNTNGIVITGNITVNGSLTFTTGTITTNANKVSVAGTVSRTSGYVIGNLELYFSAVTTSRTFDIGSGANYTPVAVAFASVSTPGMLTATTTSSDHTDIDNSGIDRWSSANRYWTLTNSVIVFTTYNATFNFVPGDLDGLADANTFIVARYSGGTWTRPTAIPAPTSTQATGLTGFGDFQVGNVLLTGLATYTISRTTGGTYTSIVSTGNSINSWRHADPAQMLDDNRSNPIPIGFDFWYDGVQYTTLSVGINGLVDFSSSAATGYTAGDYDSDNPGGTNPHTRMTDVTGGYTARNALAVMYGDLTTMNITEPLGNSIKYLTTGAAPNRVLTVEWINLSYWSQYLGESYNFQLKLYESTGVIEFFYGNNTAGTGIPLKYKTGISAPSFTALSSAVVRIQQNANSTYLLPQPVPAWGGGYGGGYNDTLPTANSKLIFTPPIPTNPTNLTFTGVTQTSMTLNWNDNATNEIGYAIYRSDDGVNYTLVRQVAAGSTSSNEPQGSEPGLLAGTEYWWKVYAVTVGGMSSLPAANSQLTLPALLYTSQGSGTWSVVSWSPAGPPPNNSNIQIRDGDVVRINQNITMNSITVGTGTSGSLLIGDNSDNTVRVLTVAGDITVNAGASFAVNTTSNPVTNHQLNLTGNINNSNIFDLASDANSRCAITFNRSGNQTISGTGLTTNFYTMNVNMGSSANNILDITSTNFSANNGFLTLTNGTFKLSAGVTITPYTVSSTIAPNTGLWINHASAIVNTTGDYLSVGYQGLLRVTNGVLNIGNVSDQQLLYGGGTVLIEGGAVNVAGRIERLNPTTILNLTISGGVITVPAMGSTSTTVAPIELTVIGSTFNWSNGNIIIPRGGGSVGAEVLGYVNTLPNTLPNVSVTGGTLQIGNGAVPTTVQTMRLNSSVPVYNLFLNSANATATLLSNLIIKNNLTITSGTLNDSTFTTNRETAGGTLALASGATLKLGGSSGGLTGSNFPNNFSAMTLDGTVEFSGTGSQTIPVLNYYNLTISGARLTNIVTLPSNTIGIAGTFTPSATFTSGSFTTSGNTIDFNGSGVQTVAATTTNFIYNNLTLSNGVSKSAGGNITVGSNLANGNSITFDVGIDTITINGNISNSGLITGSGAGAVVLTGSTSAHALSGGGSYRNITLNDANGATVTGKTTINGTLTFTSGIITVTSASDTLSVGTTGSITRTNGHVIGNLQMYIPAGASSKVFPLGTSSLYLPVRIEFADVGNAGFITVARKTDQQHPNISDPSATIDSTLDVKAYWIITNNGVVLTGTYNATFGFDAASECIGGVSPTATDFDGARWNGSTWSYVAPGLRTVDSTRLDALNAFGDFILGKSRAALIAAIKSGLWNDPTVWSGRIPTLTDTAKIFSPFTVILDANATVEKLVVNAGSTFKDSVFTLTVTGHLILDGTWTGAGTISLTTADDTIYGSGSMTGTSVLEIAGSNKTIASTANLTLNNVSILSGDTLYNSGTITIDTLVGSAASSAFVNRSGSTLIINGPVLATGTLNVGTCANTVIYNGTIDQNIKPVTYCNIIINNNGVKTAWSNFDTNGDLTVSFGSNLTIGSNITIRVRGITTTSGVLNNGGHLLVSD